MLTAEELIDHGYTKYGNTSAYMKYAEALYQKKIVDNIGIKYFIDIFAFPTNPPLYNWSAETVFYSLDGDVFIKAELYIHQEDTIEDIGTKCNNIWLGLELGYYERYN